MRRSELNWALGYSVALAAVTSLPYLLAARNQGADWRFTGFLFGVEDGNSYIAKMLGGFQGAWLFRTPYSTVDQRGVLAFLPYLLLGKLAGSSHEKMVLAYHVFRLTALPLLVVAIYRFVSRFTDQIAWRRWATVLATAGGGLGWVVLLAGEPNWLGGLPLDFYSPETFGFLAVYGLPHLALGRAVLLAALASYLHSTRGWTAGILLLFAGLIHPPIVLSGLAAITAHQVAALGFASAGSQRADGLRHYGRTVLPVFPLLGYLGASYARDPFLQIWAEQNVILSPHPLHYLLAFGAVLPLAIAGAIRLLKQREVALLFPVAWAITLPLLAYAPVNIQRRLPEAGWVALLALGAAGAQLLPGRWQVILRVGLTALLLPSTLVILIAGIQTASRPEPPAFRPTAEVAAFNWLRDEAIAGELALAAYQTSNALPAWAPVRVVAGHGPETTGLAELLPQVEGFFKVEASDEDRQELVLAQQVDFLFYGPAERALGGWEPASWDCLRSLYDAAGYAIYSTCFRTDG
ncbi:MAG: hypothetical protein ACRDHG_14950 [Anaerolineales bacterium]